MRPTTTFPLHTPPAPSTPSAGYNMVCLALSLSRDWGHQYEQGEMTLLRSLKWEIQVQEKKNLRV